MMRCTLLRNEKSSEGGGVLIESIYSLRQHDLDQVLRVERLTLLSACRFTGTPFNCCLLIYSNFLECQIKNKCRQNSGKSEKRRFRTSTYRDGLSNAAAPFFFHL